MKACNTHTKRLNVSKFEVGQLLDTLASKEDRFWPHERWPPVIFNEGLSVGATGGHGPIRYRILKYRSGQCLEFEFYRPRLLRGIHRFTIEGLGTSASIIRHEVELDCSIWGVLLWVLFYEPLHDALMEDLLSKVQMNLTGTWVRAEWGIRVKLLRKIAKVFLAKRELPR